MERLWASSAPLAANSCGPEASKPCIIRCHDPPCVLVRGAAPGEQLVLIEVILDDLLDGRVNKDTASPLACALQTLACLCREAEWLVSSSALSSV